MPYSLNIILFPFKHDQLDYTTLDCTNFDKSLSNSSLGDKLFVMEEAIMNGKDTHPVYKYLKSTATMDTILDEFATFFFISADSDRMIVSQGAAYHLLKDQVIALTKHNYDEL